jgi:RNA polymerase sigma-70 factor (ECF subfamily)
VEWSALSSDELIRACVGSGESAAWEEFVRRFRPLIAGTVIRTARRYEECPAHLLDDLIQDTFLKICADRCRILRDFRPDSPDAIFGLLKKVAFCVTHDHFRGGFTGKRWPGQRELALDSNAENTIASGEGVPQVEREIFIQEIDEQLTGGSEPATVERDRQIFWLYYRHGMTSRAIAAIPGIGLTQKGVESAIQRLTAHVRNRVARCKSPKGKSSQTAF